MSIYHSEEELDKIPLLNKFLKLKKVSSMGAKSIDSLSKSTAKDPKKSQASNIKIKV